MSNSLINPPLARLKLPHPAPKGAPSASRWRGGAPAAGDRVVHKRHILPMNWLGFGSVAFAGDDGVGAISGGDGE